MFPAIFSKSSNRCQSCMLQLRQLAHFAFLFRTSRADMMESHVPRFSFYYREWIRNDPVMPKNSNSVLTLIHWSLQTISLWLVFSSQNWTKLTWAQSEKYPRKKQPQCLECGKVGKVYGWVWIPDVVVCKVCTTHLKWSPETQKLGIVAHQIPRNVEFKIVCTQHLALVSFLVIA